MPDRPTILIARVDDWCRANVPSEFWNCSRQTYWGSALSAGVITRKEYDQGKDWYGNLWNYTGD